MKPTNGIGILDLFFAYFFLEVTVLGQDFSWLQLALERKGYTPDYMREIQDCSCDTLLDVDRFSQFLYQHPDLVYTVLPDFDTDGDCAGIIGFAGLSELGFRCHLYTPIPDMGYGFGRKVIDRLLRLFPDTQVIVTCDHGIACHEGVAYAKSLGLYVLVTDHHPQDDDGDSGETKPLVCGDVVVDPMRVDDPYSHPQICGAYVLWKCLYQYALDYGTPYTHTQIWRLRVFAGIATVGDQMPLVYENRGLVRECISVCKMLVSDENGLVEDMITGCDVYVSAFHGLQIFLKCLVEVKNISRITEELFAFYVSPMFNAVKRMDFSVSMVYQFFFGCQDDEERYGLFEDWLELNENRKVVVSDYFDDMLEQEQLFAPYMYLSDAPPKILGLLASKLMDGRTHPVFVVREDADGTLHGSGRSPEWLDFRDAIRRMPNQGTIEVKGHAHAFALSLQRQDVEPLLTYLKELAQLSGVSDSVDLVSNDLVIGDNPELCDHPFTLYSVVEYTYHIRDFEPFGAGFTRPGITLVFRTGALELSRLGKEGQHVKAVHWGTGFPILSWNQDLDQIPTHDGYYWIRGDVSVSTFGGQLTTQFTGVFV